MAPFIILNYFLNALAKLHSRMEGEGKEAWKPGWFIFMESCFPSSDICHQFCVHILLPVISFKRHSSKHCAFHVENHFYKERSYKVQKSWKRSLLPHNLPLHVFGWLLSQTKTAPFNIGTFSLAERLMSYLMWHIQTSTNTWLKRSMRKSYRRREEIQ